MRAARQMLWSALALVALVGITAVPVQAQGKAKGKYKHYAVTTDRAVTVTRTVLVRQGYEVVRVEQVGPTKVVYYKPGKRWRGMGRRPIHRMVIRTVREQVVFEETDPSVLVDIDVRLKL
jgi:Zn-dependent membrane protease YugP